MRKLISVILSLLILVGSMSSVMLTASAADTAPYKIEEHFLNPDNWSMDQETATALGTKPASSWASIANSTASINGGTITTLKLHTMNHWSSVKIPNLEKNTNYTFSFKFYSANPLASRVDGKNTYKYYFQKAVLLANDFDGANFAWNTSTATGTKEFRSDNGGYRWNDDFSSYSWITEGERTTAVTEGAWNTFTFTFNTGNYTDYRIVLLSKVDDIHLCDFNLTTGIGDVNGYLNTVSSWLLDSESATAITNTGASSWAKIEKYNLTVGNETVETLRFNTTNHRASVFLPNLKKNTEYTFSFRYYAPQLMTVATGYEGIFKEMILFTPDAENASIGWNTSTWNGVKQYYSYNGGYRWNITNTKYEWIAESERTSSAKAAEWNYVNITFNTGEYDKYAVSLTSKMTGSYVYLDQIALTEASDPVKYFENPDNWTLYANTGSKLFTDTQYSKNPNSWPDIANKTDVKKEGDKSLYFHSQNYYSSVLLPTNLQPYSTYTLSFDYYTPASTEGESVEAINPISLSACEIDGAGFFFKTPGVLCYKANNITYTSTNGIDNDPAIYGDNMLHATAGEWHNVSMTFKTSKFTKFALSFLQKLEHLYLDNFRLDLHSTVTVEGGSCDNTFAPAGSTVTLTPAAADTGMEFVRWEVTSGDVKLADATAQNATFVMPGEPVAVKAVYDYTVNNPEAEKVIGFKGNSIRKQSGSIPQGLRFKFFMDKDFETLYADYTVEKVGLLTIRTDHLSGQKLVHDSYTYDSTIRNPLDNEVLAENLITVNGDTDNVYFTASLINISAEKYDVELTVRPYTVYKHTDGTTFTVYGNQYSASVFSVVYEILASSSDANDIDAAQSAIQGLEDEYNAWVAENASAN